MRCLKCQGCLGWTQDHDWTGDLFPVLYCLNCGWRRELTHLVMPVHPLVARHDPDEAKRVAAWRRYADARRLLSG